jgi:hypothetical protein
MDESEEDLVVIHVRFSPDGSVLEIGERPLRGPNPQEWYNHLSGNVGDKFQPLSGGRGIFRVSRQEIDDLKGKLVRA